MGLLYEADVVVSQRESALFLKSKAMPFSRCLSEDRAKKTGELLRRKYGDKGIFAVYVSKEYRLMMLFVCLNVIFLVKKLNGRGERSIR